MNKFIPITILILLLSIPVYAQQSNSLWAEAQYNVIVYDDSDIDKTGQQYKALLGYKWFYLWVAMDQEQSVDWGGQEGPGFELSSLGLGVRVPIVKYLSAYAEGGKFMPHKQDSNWVTYKPGGGSWEAYSYYGVDKTGEPVPNGHFDRFKTELGNAWGGQVGLAFDFEIYNGLFLNANTGYRYCQLNRHTEMRWNPENQPANDPNGYWVFDDNQSISGWVFGIGINYSF